MMDRIEDETVRYLFFLQVDTGRAARAAVSPKRKRRREQEEPQPDRYRTAAAGREVHHGGLHAQYPAQEGKGAGAAALRRRRQRRPAAGRSAARKSAATIPAPAAAARNTRSATARKSLPKKPRGIALRSTKTVDDRKASPLPVWRQPAGLGKASGKEAGRRAARSTSS